MCFEAPKTSRNAIKSNFYFFLGKNPKIFQNLGIFGENHLATLTTAEKRTPNLSEFYVKVTTIVIITHTPRRPTRSVSKM